jgi:cation transport ATPase
MTMANRQNSSVLVNQAISKLLDYRIENVPRDSDHLRLLHPTAQKSPNYADTHAKATVEAARQWEEWRRKNSSQAKRAAKKTKGTILILIAWILLVLNVLAVIGSLHAIENTNGFLFQMGMLAFSAFILSWMTWLYLKGKAGGIVAVQLIIIVALLVTFVSMVKESGDVTTVMTNIRRLGRTLSCSFHSTTAVTRKPMCRVVNGILYSEDKPSAVVGDQIIHEGDILRYFNVVRIYKDKVEFEKNDKRWTQSIENRLLAY